MTDADLEPNGGPFTYDIRNSDGNAFSIDFEDVFVRAEVIYQTTHNA